MTIRQLLSQDPMTFNELLDLFEAYISITSGKSSRAMPCCAKRSALASMSPSAISSEWPTTPRIWRSAFARSGRHAITGSDLTITLTEIEHRQLDTAIPDLIGLLGDTASMLDLLSGGFDRGSIDADPPAIAAALRLLGRAISGADQVKVPALMMAESKIRKAVGAKLRAVIQVGEAA